MNWEEQDAYSEDEAVGLAERRVVPPVALDSARQRGARQRRAARAVVRATTAARQLARRTASSTHVGGAVGAVVGSVVGTAVGEDNIMKIH